MNSKSEVCFFLPEIVGGGAERVVCELSSHFADAGRKVTLMLLQDKKRDYIVNPKVNVIVLPTSENRIKKKIIRIKTIRKFLKNNPNCVFISFLYRTLVYALFATVGMKNKWIVSERNNPQVTPSGKINRFIRNYAFSRADRCVFQTKDAKNYFSKRIQRKATIIPNPIPDIQPKRVPNDNHIIINACRFTEQKNLPLLLEAFSEVHKIHNEYILELYGDGEAKEMIIQLVSKMQLQDVVKMPGFSSDITNCYRNSEIFVSSSDYEGISNSMLEAMSIGLPVVCTDCPIGGARMMIDNNENGILVPVRNKEALVKALLNLIENREFADRLAKNAIETCKKYTVKNIVNMWESEID